jgi:hypothetical protein
LALGFCALALSVAFGLAASAVAASRWAFALAAYSSWLCFNAYEEDGRTRCEPGRVLLPCACFRAAARAWAC